MYDGNSDAWSNAISICAYCVGILSGILGWLSGGMGELDQIRKQTKILRVYFSNRYGGKAVVNGLQFKAMTGHSLSDIETNALEHAKKYLSNQGLITSSSVYPS